MPTTTPIEDVWADKGNLPYNAIVATADGKYPALDGSLITNIAGSGDMNASVYDPNTVAADAFARANHTGTQTASTISDFDAEVSNNTTVAAKADQSTTYTIGQVDSMLTYYPLSANTYTKIEVDANIAANFTPAQADEIAANTLKTGITTAQADEIAANTLKVTYPSADSSKLAGIATGAEVNTIDSAVAGEPSGSDLVLNVVSLTQAEYDAGTPVATTFYIIT